MEQGWLIEDENHWFGHRWLRLVTSGTPPRSHIEWTTDAEMALRFARREDARAFALLHIEQMPLVLLTSHSFDLGVEKP